MTIFPRPQTLVTRHTLATLDAFGQQVIRSLRMWPDGKRGPDAMAGAITDQLGPQRGARVAALWSDLREIFDCFGHRPLDLLPCASDRLSADEASFVQLITLAADARREDAMFVALMMVRADVTPIVVSLATQVGLSLRQAILGAENAERPATHRASTSLH